MNELSINMVKRRLQRYESTVQETRAHFLELAPFGRYRAAAPYEEKYGIPVLLDALKSDDPHRQQLYDEYNRITLLLASFENEKGQKFRDLLRDSLVQYIDAWYAEILLVPGRHLRNRC